MGKLYIDILKKKCILACDKPKEALLKEGIVFNTQWNI